MRNRGSCLSFIFREVICFHVYQVWMTKPKTFIFNRIIDANVIFFFFLFLLILEELGITLGWGKSNDRQMIEWLLPNFKRIRSFVCDPIIFHQNVVHTLMIVNRVVELFSLLSDHISELKGITVNIGPCVKPYQCGSDRVHLSALFLILYFRQL